MAEPRDRVTEYARSVVEGERPACALHRAAAARHLRDLETGEYRGLYFDVDLADRAIQFFPVFLRHVKGEWAGEPIELPPWGEFVVGSLFGWRRRSGTRRFRTAYLEVPRKNAKTTILSGIAILGSFFDGEGGAEGYFAATTRDQANVGFGIASAMVKKSAALKKTVRPFRHYMDSPESESSLRPLSADAHTLDGLNPHVVVIDELHAHPNSKVVDVMETGTGSRRQPLLVEITTAGQDRNSVCWKHHEYSERVNDPNDDHDDDTWFGFMTGIDEGDDWRDPEVWAKANPSLGISVKLDDLERKCAKAQAIPSQEAAFRQKHLNSWLQVESRAIRVEEWDACGGDFDEAQLIGRRCYGGLDLAKVHDLSAFVLVWPPSAGIERWMVKAWFWVPDEDIAARSDRDRVPYEVWDRQGHITATPGNITDFDFIEETIRELCEMYDVHEIGYDRLLAGQIVTHLLEDGITLTPIGQGYTSMAPPTDEMMRLIRGGLVHHDGNPVLRWNMTNLVVRTGPAGTVKPDKERSRERIDGTVALIMAIARGMVHTEGGPSVYESRDILVL